MNLTVNLFGQTQGGTTRCEIASFDNVRAAAILVLGLMLVGCRAGTEPRAFVVRVGDDVLYESDLNRALENMSTAQDRALARDSYIEQWITTALLAEEAHAKGMDREPRIESLINDNERSILAAAVVGRMYEEEVPPPTDAQIRQYFETVRESMQIREGYVRVRYLRSANPDSASMARRLLQRAVRGGGVDSLWSQVAQRFATEPSNSIGLARTYVAESSLFGDLPGVAAVLANLGEGQIASVINDDSGWHVLQVADRAPAGTTPEVLWIEDELSRRVQLQHRKEAYARKVQDLRTAAERRNAIEFGVGGSPTQEQ